MNIADRKRVSVIIPSYKPGEYIRECIQSVCNQTIDTEWYEVIVILNGIRDPYYDELVKLQSLYVNLRVLYTPIVGVSNARNLGLDSAIGEFITFVDDDDMVSCNYLGGLLSISSKTVVAISNVHSFIVSIDSLTDNYFIVSKMANKSSYEKCSLIYSRSFLSYIGGKMIHKETIGSKRFITSLKNGEDSLFLTSLTDKINAIKFSDETSIYYVRERCGSASRRKFTKLSLLNLVLNQSKEYLKLYLSNISEYSFWFFLIRIASLFKGAYKLSKY